MINQKPASALLLTVMIIAILTTTTLASIAVRFDQLASTDKIANSAVAKSAADSALTKVKEKLAAQTAITPTIFDLDSNTESTLSTSDPYRPSPRKIVSTYQKVQTSLPRCNAVIVLLPWTNDGQYLLSQTNESNPAMIFNYANIVNDTPLGIIPGNGDLSNSDKDKTLSQLTSMGHFYNPFAPLGAKQKDLNYWTVKLGGPQDQFLTKKSTDGSTSFYKNVDFVYLPYLPRWSDSGIFTATPGTKVDRISATSLRTKFETIIKENNFKVWIDASISDAQLYQYGFGDLFVDGTAATDYRLKWLQPSLWNDTPEADSFSTPYKTDNAEASTLTWAKKNQPLMTAVDTNWKAAIVKGAKSFSFIKLANNAQTLTGDATITGFIYGSLEGLRLNQPITLVLLNRDQQPLSLKSRGQDQGRLYGAKLTKIGPTTINNGVESISVNVKLGTDDISYNTPPKATGGSVIGTDFDTIAVLAPPQYSTSNSIDSVNIAAPGVGGTIISRSGSDCQTACPGVGDLVSLTKPSAPATAPVWGKVTSIDYTNGTSFSSFTVDKLRQSPLPTREMAYTYYDQSGPKIAYYGGSVAMNDYDGGYASESDQLWIYDPEADSWTFKAPGATNPGRRAGASMVYDSINNRLVMIGGYYHELINIGGLGNCELAQSTCLYTNRPGMRIAKRVTNDVYAYNLTTNTWEKIDYTSTFDATKKIQNGTSYTARVTSTLADRSGLERWNMTAKTAVDNNQVINLTYGTKTTGVVLFPSAAGVAKGDEIYLYGNKNDVNHSNFYAWGKIDAVNYAANSVDLIVYGYKGTEAQVTMESLAIQVVKRQLTTTTCTGTISGSLYYCLLADATGYAVGDSVVLEQYVGTNLTNTLSGFISFIDTAGQAYFVTDEKTAPIKDYSDQSVGKVANSSAVAFPSARYGATFALQPTTPTKASYWEGAAKNLNSNHRFADLWSVQFAAGSGATSAVWSIPSTDNTIDPNFTTSAVYNFQVLRPSYSYQITTTNNSVGGVNPEIIKTDVTDPKTGAVSKGWNSNTRYLLDIDPNDAGRVVVGAWATLERRLNTDGTRETFHGIVEDMYSSSPCIASYTSNQLCLRHNPAYPGDSGFATDSKNVKVTMTPSFSTSNVSGGTFKGFANYVSLQNVPSDKLGTVPGVGTIVMIWNNSGDFPRNAYTFIVNSRTYAGNRTFNFYFDKLTASPHPLGYSTSQIASAGGVDRLVTITDHQMNYYDSTNAPEWIKDVPGGSWKIRLATKNPNLLYRPSPRRGGMVASIYDSGATKLFVAGGTFGQYGSLWKEEGAGLTTGAALKWVPQYVSANSVDDIPNLFGGSLVVYKSGANIRAVYFGGKQKTDLSSADYGSSIGAKMLGRPDAGTLIDNSFYIIDNAGSNDPTAVALTNTIESNPNNPTNWPGTVGNSLKFKGGDRGANVVCAYIGQVNSSSCSSKLLLSQLGSMGRLDDTGTNDTYNGWSWGKSAILTQLGDRFKSQGATPKASLIMSAPTLSGSGVNGRWEQDGYRPYCKDNASGGCLGLGAASTYGKLGADFGSDKTAGLVAYTPINNATDKGGAILATSVGVGEAIASNRGGSTGTTAGWYSYCATSELKKTDGIPDTNPDGTYICQSTATRYLPTLPDAEDLLFMLNAAQALGATDTYKIVGYYGGVKRGYLVTSVSGILPKVYEIVP